MLTAPKNVRKDAYREIGCSIKASIVKTDSKVISQETLWSKKIAGTDNIGENYNIETEIKAGEKLFFEIKCDGSDAYGECRWDPVITYKSYNCFYGNETKINSINELSKGDNLKASIYLKNETAEGLKACLVFYDSNGGMLGIKCENLDKSLNGEYKTDLYLPVNTDKLNGCKAQILLLSNTENRIFPLDNPSSLE